MRISFQEVHKVLTEILQQNNFSNDDSETCSRLFAETTCDGVYSHGLNRFPRFISYIKEGYVIPGNSPQLVQSHQAHEIWDGCLGPGNLNALKMMSRAMELAKKYAIGMVSLKNTNHWMRGGTYGWQAANAGFAAVCTTNTEPNMPPWGGSEPIIGNNPLVIAVPDSTGHFVLDMAMSQFSFGKLEDYHLQNKALPYPGGYDQNGELTTVPGEILKTRQPLPMGYWKGSGLSIMLDLLVSALSGGNASLDIGNLHAEHAVSQLFIAFNLEAGQNNHASSIVQKLKAEFLRSKPFKESTRIYYPGERTLKIRSDSLKNGLNVNEEIWRRILSLKYK